MCAWHIGKIHLLFVKIDSAISSIGDNNILPGNFWVVNSTAMVLLYCLIGRYF